MQMSILTKLLNRWNSMGGHAGQHAGLGISSNKRLAKIFDCYVRASGNNYFDKPATSTATITYGANPAGPASPRTIQATLSTSQAYWTDTGFVKGNPLYYNQSYFGYNKPFGPRTGAGVTNANHIGGFTRKIRTDAPILKINAIGSGVNAPYRVAVDGAKESDDIVLTDNGQIALDFGGVRKFRTIAFMGEQSGGFGDLIVGASDTVFPAVGIGDLPVVLINGDSHISGSNKDAAAPALSIHLTLPGVLREISGCNVISMGLGGTGYIKPGPSIIFSDPVRVADEAAQNPDLCVYQMGSNDLKIDLATQQSFSAEVIANVVSSFSRRRAAMPGVPFVVFDLNPGCSNGSPQLLQLSADIEAGINQHIAATGDKLIAFISQNRATATTDPWILGERHTGLSSGAAGNSEYLISIDGVHLSTLGNTEIPKRIWSETLRSLASMLKV